MFIALFCAGALISAEKTKLKEKSGEEKRVGRHFNENGMWVYDVEVLDVKILDADVKKLLSDAQRSAIVAEVNTKQESLRLNSEKLKEDVNRQIYEAQMTTLAKAVELEGSKRNLSEAKTQATIELDKLEKVGHAENEAKALEISTTARVEASTKEADVDIKILNAKVAAFKDEMSAIQPELIATLKVLGNQHLTAELAKNLSPLAILGGESVADVLERLLKSLPIGTNAEGLTEAVRGLGRVAERR